MKHLGPIAPGVAFLRDFVAALAGIYHLHVGLQIDRVLIETLIVEEKSTVAFARSPRNRFGSFFIVASKATSASLAPIVEH